MLAKYNKVGQKSQHEAKNWNEIQDTETELILFISISVQVFICLANRQVNKEVSWLLDS